MPLYVLDTSLFVQAQRQYYARDIAPGFWTNLIALHAAGVLTSIDQVLDEINSFHDFTDPLGDWANTICPPAMFESTADPQIVSKYGDLVDWINLNPQYLPAALAEFSRGADGWVVAYAIHHGCSVVSMEVSAQHSTKSAKIPDICKAFGVTHIDTYEMMRSQNISLV